MDKFAVRNSVCFYLTVIPKYRFQVIRILQNHYESQIIFCANLASSDGSVFTDETIPGVRILRMINFRNIVYIQFGEMAAALRSEVLVLDLNPRSLTAWFFLLFRKFQSDKRTIVWGHLHSRFQVGRLQSKIRILMRFLADATIVYTYSDYKKAKKDLPRQQVFVAPNAIESRNDQIRSTGATRDVFIYSGRLVPEKKVTLLLRAFYESKLMNEGINLVVVGTGPDVEVLKKLSEELKLKQSVQFVGEIFDHDKLAKYYSGAIASISPGYVGLSLTQSASFGVPMILPRGENHSPEIEIVERIKHYQFDANSAEDLSLIMNKVLVESKSLDFEKSCFKMVDIMRSTYCVELMAEGLISAVDNAPNNCSTLGGENEP